MDFDEILGVVGNFGRYQKLLLILLCAPLLLGILHTFIQVFTAGESDHWCQSWQNENCNEMNVTSIECDNIKKELSVPFKVTDDNETVFEQCLKYNISSIDLKTATDVEVGNITTLKQIPCDEGWVFDRSTFPSTIIIDVRFILLSM